MSVFISALCWQIDLPPMQKLVLISLADQANDAGLCWPSIASIQKRTGLGERAVQQCINNLVSTNLLSRETGGGRGKTTRYIVNPASETPYQKPRITNPVSGAGFEAGNPASGARKPRTTCTQTVKEPSRISPPYSPPPLSGKRPLPDDWKPSLQTIETLSREFGLRVPEDVDRYVAAFRDACQAKDYRYKDFDAAFRNCVRQDWPKLREKAQKSKSSDLMKGAI